MLEKVVSEFTSISYFVEMLHYFNNTGPLLMYLYSENAARIYGKLNHFDPELEHPESPLPSFFPKRNWPSVNYLLHHNAVALKIIKKKWEHLELIRARTCFAQFLDFYFVLHLI